MESDSRFIESELEGMLYLLYSDHGEKYLAEGNDLLNKLLGNKCSDQSVLEKLLT